MKKIIEFFRKLLSPNVIIKEVPKTVYMYVDSLGEIQSERLCKYVLNELVRDIEHQRKNYLQRAPFLDFNDRNSALIVGEAQGTFVTYNKIKQFMEDYYNASKGKKPVASGYVEAD